MGTASEMYRVWGHIVEEAECLQRSLKQFTKQKSSKHKTEQRESSSHHGL